VTGYAKAVRTSNYATNAVNARKYATNASNAIAKTQKQKLMIGV